MYVCYSPQNNEVKQFEHEIPHVVAELYWL